MLMALGGCAARPANPPIAQADPSLGYRFETRMADGRKKENLVILAFSGGGTRAAAFSYGALEFLRRTEVFVLSDEAVDRLRAAAGKIMLDSSELQRPLKQLGAKIVAEPRP